MAYDFYARWPYCGNHYRVACFIGIMTFFVLSDSSEISITQQIGDINNTLTTCLSPFKKLCTSNQSNGCFVFNRQIYNVTVKGSAYSRKQLSLRERVKFYSLILQNRLQPVDDCRRAFSSMTMSSSMCRGSGYYLDGETIVTGFKYDVFGNTSVHCVLNPAEVVQAFKAMSDYWNPYAIHFDGSRKVVELVAALLKGACFNSLTSSSSYDQFAFFLKIWLKYECAITNADALTDVASAVKT